jgi:uncharacterized membrane protein YcaP (DUF421 family)
MNFSDILHTVYASIGSLIVLFFLTKLMGSKQISQLNMFDYINGITIGSIAAEMAVSDEVHDLLQPALAMIIYGATGLFLAWLTNKSLKCRKFISGTPLLLIENGKLYPENLKTAKLDIGDLLTRARSQGYFDITKIDYAIFENTGAISFMQSAKENPLTPKDLGYEKEADKLVVNLIMDGIVIEKNLKHCGKEMKWLFNQLRKQGYSSPEQIFLAVIDKDDNLTLFPQSQKQNKKDFFE